MSGGRFSKNQVFALLALSLGLAGCGSGGFSMKDAEVDRSLYTSNVPATADRDSDANRVSDEATIRNAVSSADIETLAGATLPWANADTGARGAINGLTEYTGANGTLCRRFTTTRESFDGVHLFKGEACMAGSSVWRLQTFESA